MKKRFLSFLLVLTMVFLSIPAGIFAENEEEQVSNEEQISEDLIDIRVTDEPANDEISNEEQEDEKPETKESNIDDDATVTIENNSSTESIALQEKDGCHP